MNLWQVLAREFDRRKVGFVGVTWRLVAVQLGAPLRAPELAKGWAFRYKRFFDFGQYQLGDGVGVIGNEHGARPICFGFFPGQRH